MKSENKLNWWDLLSIVGAVGTFGIGWIADNEATVIAFLAIGLVWLIRLVFDWVSKRFGKNWKLGKPGLTILVFAVSLVLSFLIKQAVFPDRPVWTGDASTFAPLLIAYISALLQVAAGVVSYATGVYNILLAKVLEKLPSNILGTATIFIPLLILIVAFVLIT